MRAKKQVNGLYRLIEALGDATHILGTSQREAVVVALAFLIGGTVLIGGMFVMGAVHDMKLAEQKKANPHTLAHGHAMYPITIPHGHKPGDVVHPPHVAHQTWVQHHGPIAHPAAIAAPPLVVTHQGVAVPDTAHPSHPLHQAYPIQHNGFPAQPFTPAAHAGFSSAEAAYQAVPHSAHPVGTLGQPVYHQPVHGHAQQPAASQYAQGPEDEMRMRPLIASPYPATDVNLDAPMHMPPHQFGSPRDSLEMPPNNGNLFAGIDSGRAEANVRRSVSNTY